MVSMCVDFHEREKNVWSYDQPLRFWLRYNVGLVVVSMRFKFHESMPDII